jgi:uncharacterized protein
VVEPAADHPGSLRRLRGDTCVGGNLVSDVHLAALSIEHRCVIVSGDHDFSRFPDVRWQRPADRPDGIS